MCKRWFSQCVVIFWWWCSWSGCYEGVGCLSALTLSLAMAALIRCPNRRRTLSVPVTGIDFSPSTPNRRVVAPPYCDRRDCQLDFRPKCFVQMSERKRYTYTHKNKIIIYVVGLCETDALVLGLALASD